MSKKEELIEKYTAQLEKAGVKVDADLLDKVTTGCGPAIYNADAATVAASDDAELETVKNNFLIKKLGLTESDDMIDAIKEVCNQIGSSVPNKYRAVVYYMLTKKYGKENIYN